MKTSTLAAFLFASLATAFDVYQYPNRKCTGMQVSALDVNAEKGCVVAREDGYLSSLMVPWTSDGDNNLVLALYSDTKCCHAKFVRTVDWEESCIALEQSESVGSFRAVDPQNPDGEGTDYSSCESEVEFDDQEVQKVEGIPPTF